MSTNRAPIESGLQDIRLEWVEETTPGETPADPAWNKFTAADLVADVSVSPEPQYEQRQALGFIDAQSNDRGAEAASATIGYHMGQFPVDASGNVQDPIAYPIVHDGETDYPSLTVVARRDVQAGGSDGGGFREFAVVTGARPTSASFDGDASNPMPLPQELSMECERARVYVISQPSSSTELVVRSTDDSDTNDVTLESEDASTTETVTLPGTATNTVTTTATFDDLDAIDVSGDHAGDITVGTDDGSGNIDVELTEHVIAGSGDSAADSIDSEFGIPALGSGSHASAITEEGPQFIETTFEVSGTPIAPNLHTLGLSVERDVSRSAQQTTRREVVDVGARSISVDVTASGEHQSATQIRNAFNTAEFGTITYTFDSGETIDLNNVQQTGPPAYERGAGDTNVQPSVTLTPTGDPAISINKS